MPEAKTDAGEYDFRKVSADTIKGALGDGLKTTVQIVEKSEANAELDDLAKQPKRSKRRRKPRIRLPTVRRPATGHTCPVAARRSAIMPLSRSA
ncbi:MAG: hypothetical protein R3D34_06810 [Nitratireductor sp.]